MNTTDILQPDSAMLAKEDIGSSFIHWEVAELKPGEKKTIKHHQKEKRKLEKEIQQLEEELEILKIAHRNAVEFEAAETANRKNIETEIQTLQSEIEKLRAQLNAKQERKGKLKKAIKQHIGSHDDLKEREPALVEREPQKETSGSKNKFLKVLFRQILPGIMLVLFCIFDAKNMYDNLNNYNNDTIKHSFISAIIFVAVLFTSFGVKMKNTFTFWFAFLVFLTLANVPQFLGRDPKFGLSNLTSSPEHMVIFALSFGGSILITLLNLSLKEKRKDPSVAANTSISQEPIETPAAKTLKSLYKELDATDNSINMLEKKIAEKQNQSQQKKNDAEQDTASKTTEKIAAIKSFAEKQNQIEDRIEKITTQFADLQDACISSIEKYRQEVSIHQLIHDYPEAVNYVDIKSIII